MKNSFYGRYVRGHHTRKIFTKVTQIVQFFKRNDLGLVLGHLNQWFWSEFAPKFSVVLDVRGTKMKRVDLDQKFFHGILIRVFR